AARGIMAQHGSHVIDSLPDICVPTLVLVGAGDQPFLAASEYMAAKIPGARKVVIPDAGHTANVDQPEAFNRAVLELLEATGCEPWGTSQLTSMQTSWPRSSCTARPTTTSTSS